MSFLDPYEANRRLSLLGWLRLGAWTLIALVLGLLAWWWFG